MVSLRVFFSSYFMLHNHAIIHGTKTLVVQIKCIMVRVLKIYWKIYFCISRFAKKHKIELRIKQYDEIKHDIICGYYKIRPHFRVGAKHFWEGTVYFRDRTVKGAMMMLNAKFQSISQHITK